MTARRFPIFLLAVVAAACVGVSASAQEPEELHISAAPVLNLRTGPGVDTRVAHRLEPGTRLRARGRSAGETSIAGSRAAWYEVEVVGEETRGWVFGAYLIPLDPERPEVAFGALVDRFERLPSPYHFEALRDLARSIAEVKDEHEENAEMAVLWLRAVDATGQHVFGWPPRDPVRAAWVDAHESYIMYFEPGGSWNVHPDAYWRLAERFRGTPAEERIAWRAVESALFECEDDPSCWLAVGRLSFGRFLDRFPDGDRTGDAVRGLGDFVRIAADHACWNAAAGEPRTDPDLIEEVRDLLRPFGSEAANGALADLDRIDPVCAGKARSADQAVAEPPTAMR